MANIAEGFHRAGRRDFMKFLNYSRASIAETASHCYVALDQGYIDESEMVAVNNHANIIWKKVNSFISYLSKTSKAQSNKENK